METYKTCTTCKQAKLLEDFTHSKDGAHGRASRCRSCNATYREHYDRRLRARITIVIPETKRCPRCDTNKPASSFSPNRANLDGLSGLCKSCSVILSSRYARTKHEKAPVEYSLKTMLIQSRCRANRKNLPFDLDFEFLWQTFAHLTHCPIIGISLDWQRAIGNSPNSPSLDKILPDAGYVKGNVQVISRRANAMKNDASMEELKRFGEWCRSLNISAAHCPNFTGT